MQTRTSWYPELTVNMFSTATTISSTSSVNIIGTTIIISNNKKKKMKKKKNLSEMQKIVLMGTTHVHSEKKNYFKNFLKKTLICLRSQMKDLITNWIRQRKMDEMLE